MTAMGEKSYLKDPKCAECRLRDLPAMACVFCEDHKAFQPRLEVWNDDFPKYLAKEVEKP